MQKSLNLKLNPADINTIKRDYPSLAAFSQALRKNGCAGCNLGSQKSLCGPVVYRGNVSSKILIIGEGSGKIEDQVGKVFVGPAGQKGDEIFAAIGLDTNTHCCLTNTVMCRPIAPWGTNRENNPPNDSQINACKVWLNYVIELINPKVIILEGRIAVNNLLPDESRHTLAELVGNFYKNSQYQDVDFFVMYHPSALIRQKEGSDLYHFYRQKTWLAINKLKGYLKENNLV